MKSISDVLRHVHQHFVYSTDKSRTGRDESWGALPADIPEGFVLRDDCEGFAMFCRSLILKHLPDVKTYLVICKIKSEGHCILRAVEPDGKEYYLDNRYKSLKTLDQLVRDGYEFMLMSGDQPGDRYAWVTAQKKK